MQRDEFSKFAQAWNAAWELCGRTPTTGAIRLAFAALERYDLSAVTKALTRHANDPDVGQFPPKPADVVRHLDGDNASRALRAWSLLIETLKRVGPWQTVVFDDPIIHAVLADMGGWITLGTLTDDEAPFKAREFEKRYQGYVAAGVSDYPRKLIGQFEHRNAESGREVPLLRLIGDERAARQVLAGGKTGPRLTVTTAADLADGVKALAHGARA